jgi:hypothetical protein
MSKKLIVSVAAACGVLLAGGAVLAASSGTPITSPQVIALKETTTSFVQDGRHLIATTRFESDGAPAGTNMTECVLVSKKALCHGVAHLQGGQVVYSFAVPGSAFAPDGTYKAAILGGTRSYQHVHGYINVRTVTDPTSRDTFYLTP